MTEVLFIKEWLKKQEVDKTYIKRRRRALAIDLTIDIEYLNQEDVSVYIERIQELFKKNTNGK
jgi:hypothetical protein